MGYTTVFEGSFQTDRAMDEETYKLVLGLSKTRRMKRDPKKLEELGFGPAESHGAEGEFFYNEADFEDFGQTEDDSVLEYNQPPSTQPGLWLDWEPMQDQQTIMWSGKEKTYGTEKWMAYLSEKVLKPRGYSLSGAVNAVGEDKNDKWHLIAAGGDIARGEDHTSKAGRPSFEKWRKAAFGY